MKYPEYYMLIDEKIVPCDDYKKWRLWYRKFSNRKIALHETKRFVISTIFLGTDHNTNPANPVPILFETMVFKQGDESGEAVYCQRYISLDDAKKGHENVRKKYI